MIALPCHSDPQMAKTYNEAVSIVDPTIAAGKLPTLWVAFAKMYEANGWFVHICYVFHPRLKIHRCSTYMYSDVGFLYARRSHRLPFTPCHFVNVLSSPLYSEAPGDLPQARLVLDRATAVPFKHVEDLASVCLPLVHDCQHLSCSPIAASCPQIVCFWHAILGLRYLADTWSCTTDA